MFQLRTRGWMPRKASYSSMHSTLCSMFSCHEYCECCALLPSVYLFGNLSGKSSRAGQPPDGDERDLSQQQPRESRKCAWRHQVAYVGLGLCRLGLQMSGHGSLSNHKFEHGVCGLFCLMVPNLFQTSPRSEAFTGLEMLHSRSSTAHNCPSRERMELEHRPRTNCHIRVS